MDAVTKLFGAIRTSIDAAAEGALMGKNYDEAYELLETMGPITISGHSQELTSHVQQEFMRLMQLLH